ASSLLLFMYIIVILFIVCEDDGGLLVEVDSKGENDFLKLSACATKYWLGGTDEQKEGVWIWSHSQNLITFTDWREGEPNNYNGNEHCLSLKEASGYAWNDGPCQNLMPFICEKGK
ncbi:perlucin-like, partial [Mytilus trossulus]|uniref:perlucin-like n=1 Tax=Mytilus trossulus TaxID=6551 RepID=UPI0030065C85